jgi:branched-chain amino acid transport system substrate-binding protein
VRKPLNTLKFIALLALSSTLHLNNAYAEGGTILIGQTADFSGPQSALVKETVAAAKAYFNKINAEGGVRGKKIELRSVDDGFEPKRSVENVKKLAEDKALVALILSRGTANAEALLPVLSEIKVPLLGPVGASQILYTPPNRYLFNLRTPFQTEVFKAITQLNSQGLTQLAAVYSDDAFGKDALQGFDKALAHYNLKPVVRVSIPRGSTDVAAAVDKLAEAKPQATMGICIAKACAALLKAMRAKGVNSQFLSMSHTSSNAYIQDLGTHARGVIVTQLFPYPLSGITAVAKELRELAAQANFVPSYATMEGMLAAKVMVEALKRAGDNPTPEKVTIALESLHDHDFGGFRVNFGPGNRMGSEYVDLTMISRDGKFIR